jgi:hypothetical protein
MMKKRKKKRKKTPLSLAFHFCGERGGWRDGKKIKARSVS